jgi:hypothetical protein
VVFAIFVVSALKFPQNSTLQRQRFGIVRSRAFLFTISSMKNKIAKIFSLSLLLTVFVAHADVAWKDYSPEVISEIQQSGKPILIAFKKKGCPTCVSQERALEKILPDEPNIVPVKVQWDDPSSKEANAHFNARTWGFFVLMNKSGEIARTKPGMTKEQDIREFLKQAH